MGSLIRLVFGAPVAVIVTAGLFLMMYALIYVKNVRTEEAGETIVIDLSRKMTDTSTRTADSFDPPDVKTPPPPPPAINNSDYKPELGVVAVAAPKFDANVDIGTGYNPDRDAQPIVRIAPDYPERCQKDRGGDEIVVVQFNVTPTGQVVDAKVTSSTNSCLNRSAIRAVLRWKYNPKIVDGSAVPRTGVVTTLRYQLADE